MTGYDVVMALALSVGDWRSFILAFMALVMSVALSLVVAQTGMWLV